MATENERGTAPPPARGGCWAAAEAWDHAFAASPDATAFHSRAWGEVAARFVPGHRARALGLALSDGAVAILPVAVRTGLQRRGPFARAVASLRNAGRSLTPADWRDVHRALDRVPLGRLDCFGSVLEPAGGAGAKANGERTTCVIELGDLPAEARAHYRASCRRAVRKAEKAALKCARLTSRPEVDEYAAIYAESTARWGKDEDEGDPPALFHDLVAQPGIEFWGVRRPDGRLDAAGIFLFSAAHCVYWHGALRMEGAEDRPANLLHDRLIEEARARGCRLYDFNPTSSKLEGVETFKHSFRPEVRTFHRWRHVHPWWRRLRRQPPSKSS